MSSTLPGAALGAILLLAPGTVGIATAEVPVQEPGERDPDGALDRFRKYLARSPFHGRVFDSLLELAVAQNRVEELVESYEAVVAAGPDDRSARVVLARLHARLDRFQRALELLEPLERDDPLLLALTGRLRLREGLPAEAAADLEAAAAGTRDLEVLREVHAQLADAYLALDRMDACADALERLAASHPDDYHLRLEVADHLARRGLDEHAVAQFRSAEELAGDDVERRCRVLAELGRMYEFLLRGDEAIDVYFEASSYLARGHWLREDLTGRILRLHRQSGRLDSLVRRYKAEHESRPRDLAVAEALSDVLEATGRGLEAVRVLDSAVEDYPEDLGLAKRRIALFEWLSDSRARIAEHQRILAEHPGEAELRFELGAAFADEAQFDQARLQWQRLLRSGADPELADRIARRWAAIGQEEDAVRCFELAISFDPGSMGRYQALYEYLADRGRGGAGDEVLSRAERAAAGSAGALEELAELHFRNGTNDEAVRVMASAVELDPLATTRLSRLADMRIELGDREGAGLVLRRLVDLARDGALRSSALGRFVGTLHSRAEIERAMRRESDLITNGARDAAPYLILAELYASEGEETEAIATLRDLLGRRPDDLHARTRLTELFERVGDLDSALAEYDQLIELFPQRARGFLLQKISIYLDRGQRKRAFATVEALEKSSPDNAQAMRDCAAWYRKLDRVDRAIRALEQAVRLDPDRGRARLELAALYTAGSDVDAAVEQYVLAWRSEESDVSGDAVDRLHELLVESKQLKRRMADLRRASRANPYDLDTPLLVSELHVREGDYQLALTVLNQLLIARPYEASLLARRADILSDLGLYRRAISDLEALRLLADTDHEELSLRLIDANLAARIPDRAIELAGEVRDPLRVAELMREHGRNTEAIEYLDTVAARGAAPAVQRMLGDLYRERGEPASAIAAYERYLDAAGEDWAILLRIGELRFELGDKAAGLEVGLRLVLSAGERQAVESYYTSRGLHRELAEARCERIAADPTDDRAIVAGLTGFFDDPNAAEAAVALTRRLALAAEEGRGPASRDPESWTELLHAYELELHRRNEGLNRKRLAELKELRDGGGPMGEKGWVDYFWALDFIRAFHERERPNAERALREHPDSAPLLSVLATRFQSIGDAATAAILYERLGTRLSEQDLVRRAEVMRLRLWDEHVRATRKLVPATLRAGSSDAEIERLARLTFDPRRLRGVGGSLTLDAEEALRGHAVALATTGDTEGARERLARLRPEDAEDLPGWIFLAEGYVSAGLYDDAGDVFARIWSEEERLAADETAGSLGGWRDDLAQRWRRVAVLYERQGELFRAYDLLRSANRAAQAYELLERRSLHDVCAERYDELIGELELALSVGAERRERKRRTLYNAGVKLAEIHQLSDDWEGARATWERVATHFPDDVIALSMGARFAELGGESERALAALRAVIAAKRTAPVAEEPARWDERRLVPLVVPRGITGPRAGTWIALHAIADRRGPGSTVSERLAIARIQLEAGDWPAAVAAFEELEVAVPDADEAWVRQLSLVLRAYDVETGKADLYGVLHRQAPDDYKAFNAYVRALMEEDRLREARTAVEGYLASGAVATDRARRSLERVLSRIELLEEIRGRGQ